jgi:hypothetical protein
LSRWDGLVHFLDDAVSKWIRIALSARCPDYFKSKKLPFCRHDEGAVNWACLASLIDPAKIHGIDPQTYLVDILAKHVNGWTVKKLDELLPWVRAKTAGCLSLAAAASLRPRGQPAKVK